MIKWNLQVAVFMAFAMMATAVNAGPFRIQEMSGLVLVNNGDAFQTAKAGQDLDKGDQIYVLDHAAVVLAEQNGCFVKIRHNALITLKYDTLCDMKADAVKFTGTRFASAIGLIEEPASDATAKEGTGAIGDIEVEDEPVKITEGDVKSTQSPESETSISESIATKLAVPATVLGAIGFSALVGGGGLLGNDSGDGGTSENDPISPS